MNQMSDLIQGVKISEIRTIYGCAKLYTFCFEDETSIPLLYKEGPGIPLVRIQSACLLGTVFHSIDCDCRDQIEKSMEELFQAPHFAFIYMPDQEARGHGLYKKTEILAEFYKTRNLLKAREAAGASKDLRKYDRAAAILKYMKIDVVCLVTNDKNKIMQLKEHGITVIK